MVSELIISVRSEFMKVYELVNKYEGQVSYADAVTGFMRVRLLGMPCSEEYYARVSGLAESISSLVDWCRYEVKYVQKLQRAGSVRECLTALKSYSTNCFTVGGAVRCVKALGEGDVMIDFVRAGGVFKLRVRLIRGTVEDFPTGVSTQPYECRADVVRNLLGVLCEFSKYLSRCLDEVA